RVKGEERKGTTFHSSLFTLQTSSTPSRSVDSGSKRYVVLRTLLRVSNLLDQLIEMLGRVYEVHLVRVDDQQWRLVVPVKVVRVRVAELLEVILRDRLLVRPSALLHAFE